MGLYQTWRKGLWGVGVAVVWHWDEVMVQWEWDQSVLQCGIPIFTCSLHTKNYSFCDCMFVYIPACKCWVFLSSLSYICSVYTHVISCIVASKNRTKKAVIFNTWHYLLVPLTTHEKLMVGPDVRDIVCTRKCRAVHERQACSCWATYIPLL